MRPEIKEQIESLIKNNSVILFMKGNKERPQCGFSKQVVSVLSQMTTNFATIDVLADPEIREGIKIYSQWPTIPQLYIDGEFIGGCDIVTDMAESQELQRLLKLEKALKSPELNVSPRALEAFKNALKDQAPGEVIRISIDANFEHSLEFAKPAQGDFQVVIGEVSLVFDAYSARRAEQLAIDFVEDHMGAGFSFVNPNEPAAVQELSVDEFNRWRSKGEELLLIDVRPRSEWELAHIDFALRLEDLSPSALAALDKNATVVFHCHHGGRSKRVAESFRAQGFRKLYNLSGGIDAWSRNIDPSIPTY